MLPISLYIEGLHSYASPVEIDFTRFYKNKLFGIFGDTGSGKSSILDAIILSIYGDSPRLGKQKRTEAINPLKDYIKIRFLFTISGQKYLIERTIGKQNKVKLSIHQNGIFIPLTDKDKEFELKIKEIIGLTRDEFCKVVILPQNKFAEFLQQKPAERAEMIGNIFDINIFGEPLYNTVNNKLKETETAKTEKEKRLNELQEVTENLINKKESELKSMQDELNKLSIKQKDLNQKLEVFKTLIQILNEKSNYEQKLRLMEEKKSEIEEKRRRLEKQEELHRMIAAAESAIEIKKKIETLKERQKNTKLEINRTEAELKKINSFVLKINEEIRKITDSEEQFKEKLKKLAFSKDEERLYNILPSVLPDLKKFKDLNEEISKLNKNLAQERTLYEKTFRNITEIVSTDTSLKIDIEDAEKTLEEEIEKLKNYLKELEVKNLASTLSRYLKPGQPCPVCGSIEHPQPFQDNVQEIMKAVENEIGKLEEIKKKIKPELKKLIEIRSRISQVNETLKEKEEVVLTLKLQISDKLPHEYWDRADELFLSLKKKKEEYDETIKKIDENRNALIQKNKILNENLSGQANIKAHKEQLEIKLKEIEIDVNKNLENLNEKTGGTDPEELRNRAKSELENIKALAKEIEQWENSLNKVKGALKSAEERLMNLPIKELPDGEPERTINELELINQNIAKINEKIGSIKESIKRDREALVEKGILSDEIKHLSTTSTVLQRLKNILIGKQMVKFLSMYLFNDIIRLANKLLDDLIGKRFRLNISENLAFSVKDLFYNKDRPVETLSGGETFIVSFALSLALSYYIQLRRKKSIQFFFIDEGFSSLDKDLLESVCNIFQELRSQDRLVGIISHISELKQLIADHIYVYRDNTGASRIR